MPVGAAGGGAVNAVIAYRIAVLVGAVALLEML
jgi:hypothetical protein